MTWTGGAGALLALLALGTPAGVHVLGPVPWALLFVAVAGAVPFALLAGLVRYRLLSVDVYVTRTLSYGVLSVGVMSAYALAASVAGQRFPLAVPVVVAVLAAATGERLRRWLERLADRFITGSRVHRSGVVRHLTESLADGEPDTVARRAVDAVRDGLDVAWVRLAVDDRLEVAGEPGADPPTLTQPLVAAGEPLGRLECGPRHGGWAEPDVQLVEALARHVALALAHDRLTRQLERQVDELVASRRRLVRVEEQTRRRLERDLHDGVQQHLVALLARLELLRATLPGDGREGETVAAARNLALGALTDLRELVRGIHPALLGDQGLVPAVRARADVLAVPVTVDVDPRIDGVRFPPEVESAAYFVVLEALTNVLKHSGASGARVVLSPTNGRLTVAVADQGRGFAAGTEAGTGLAGLRDRVAALGGVLDVRSAVGAGTTVTASFPVPEVVRA